MSEPLVTFMASSSSKDPPPAQGHVAEANKEDDAQAQQQLLEMGSHLMLQQHLAYNGYLLPHEQERWKAVIKRALADKSYNDASRYLLDKLHEPLHKHLKLFIFTSHQHEPPLFAS